REHLNAARRGPTNLWRRAAAPSAPFPSFSSLPGGGERRRRAWEASLSPLERVRGLLAREEAAAVTDVAPVPVADAAPAAGSPLRAGELALVELSRRQRDALKLLCRLAAGATLAIPGGLLPHDDIVGRLPGQLVRTAGGLKLLVRRPSLEEYALLMTRSATIAYPKDVSAMLTMMDLHPGDTVLESGSGSGALSLFLSRAVGSKGRVLSYEIREDHHSLAKKNYRQWRSSWEIGHMEEWPDNVDFIHKDITTAAEDMKSVTFDAVVLDMLNPQAALPVIRPSLKHGGVCAVYLAKIAF
uniref:tRNA (adenine(58)-N(1))-methyltransferase n=1 Tax=Nothoprocta perdicaria TaxID=30464 RepID=A0A8C6YRE5_NOTPE